MACYDLDAVRAAAKRGAIDHLGRRAALDISALADMGVRCKECLSSLELEDFDATETYDAPGLAGGHFDVYKLKWRVGDRVYPLYIKLKLVTNTAGEQVLLASFHQHRG